MHQLIILLLGVISLSGSIVGTFGTISIRDFELRGYVDPTQDSNLPFIMSRLGVNVQLEQYDSSALHDNLELIQASNFTWVRQFAYWDAIELTQGTYNWQTWDTIIEAIGDYPELELVVVLMNTPSWARENSDTTQTAPPQSPESFATFAHHFAERYGHTIDYYQIWDEPNLDDAWGLLNPRPAEYVALLTEAYQAIHNADTTATVMSAALAPTTEQSGQNISDIQYLDAMYRLGAKDYIDIVAAKPYGFSMSPLDRTVDESTLNFSRIIALREVMLNYDDGKTSLWASHWGWNALPDDWQGTPSIWGEISQEQQAHYTLQALDRVHRELPWLGGMILHQWQPNVAPDNPQWGFALLDQDNNPTPLLEAIQSYNLPDLPQNGLYPARNNAARFSGVWTFSELGADIGWLETTDSQFEFEFVGTDIALLLNEGDYVAFLYPSVDNQPANATPMDNQGNAYIFLRSDSLNRESNLNLISTQLEHGAHTLHVVADKGWDQWAIRGFAVSSGNLAQPYNQQITVGIIAIIMSSLVTIMGIITVPWAQLYPIVLPISRHISETANLILSGVTSLILMIAMLATWSTHKPNILARDEIHILVSIITAGLLYLSPNIIITLVSAVVLFLLLYQRIESGLVLIILWSPFFIFPVELYTFAFLTVEIILIITVGAWILQQLTTFGITLQMRNSQYPTFNIRQAISRLHMLDFGIIGIVLIAFLSLLWSQYPERAITELRQYIIEPTIFYVMIRSIRPNKQTYQQLVDALILAGVLVATIGLVQYIQGQGIITAEAGAKRLASVYGSPNNVGLMLGRAIPFALAFVLIYTNTIRRIWGLSALIVMSIALALTQSVGAILLGIPASIIIILVTLYGRRSIFPITGVGILGGLGFGILTQISARFANILDLSNGTNFFRLRVWESALEIIQDYPLTGIGLDQFLYVFRGHYIRPDAIWDRDLSHPHNVILDYWTRLGLAGVVLFIIIQVSFWQNCLRAVRYFAKRDPLMLALSVGLMGSMADLLAHGWIDNSVFVYDLAFIFALQLALSIGIQNIQSHNEL